MKAPIYPLKVKSNKPNDDWAWWILAVFLAATIILFITL